ncbi:MAG: FeoA domain-containing protein [Planctomycetota bacterium]|nr:FeoA domain-containing protein [Planctomycetota bacterium]
MPDLLPLHYLHAGHTAEVVQIIGSPDQVQRVHEMGLLRGTHVKMIQGGTPCIIRTEGQTLCIRGTELLRVMVRHVISQPGAVA